MVAGIAVRQLRDDPGFGAIVEGLNWQTVEDPEVRVELNRLFEERGLLVFEGCEPSSQFHVAIFTVFGPLKDHPTKVTPRVDAGTAPGVIDIHSLPRAADDDEGAVLLGGRRLVRYSPWHFDHCYNDELNRAGVLRALVNAPEGGRTGFADGIDLYRRLSPELRARIEGLNVIYTLDTRLSRMRFGRPPGFRVLGDDRGSEGIVREASTFPRAMHPAVWTRGTGEKVLHVGGWMAVGVEHHEDAEGDALLDAVCQEINERAVAYWHDWRPTDFVIWDNWRMVHAVEGNAPEHERRTQRTTIRGDYGLGYFEDGKKIGEVQRELAI